MKILFSLLCAACAVQADICFIVDSSGSIRDNNPSGWVPGGPTDNWTLLLEFVSEIISTFTVSQSDTHVGVVVFSDNAVLSIRLTDYYDEAELLSQVRQINYVGGFTNTADALRVTREQCFSRSNGNRDSANDLAIIITDGVPTLNTGRTEPEAELLKDSNVQVIAVGITNNVDSNTLRMLSSPPQQRGVSYFEAPQFTQLGDILDGIIEQACATAPPTSIVPGMYNSSLVRENTSLLFGSSACVRSPSGCYVLEVRKLYRNYSHLFQVFFLVGIHRASHFRSYFVVDDLYWF